MAVKADGSGRRLSEAELNAPDLDDDGELDVETYLLPSVDGIEDPYLADVWEAALGEMDNEDTEELPVSKELVELDEEK